MLVRLPRDASLGLTFDLRRGPRRLCSAVRADGRKSMSREHNLRRCQSKLLVLLSRLPRWRCLQRRLSGRMRRSRKWPPEQAGGAVSTGTSLFKRRKFSLPAGERGADAFLACAHGHKRFHGTQTFESTFQQVGTLWCFSKSFSPSRPQLRCQKRRFIST